MVSISSCYYSNLFWRKGRHVVNTQMTTNYEWVTNRNWWMTTVDKQAHIDTWVQLFRRVKHNQAMVFDGISSQLNGKQNYSLWDKKLSPKHPQRNSLFVSPTALAFPLNCTCADRCRQAFVSSLVVSDLNIQAVQGHRRYKYLTTIFSSSKAR